MVVYIYAAGNCGDNVLSVIETIKTQSLCGAQEPFNRLVGIVIATAAVVGWLYQRHLTRTLARKQHTMNVMLSMRLSELLNSQLNNVRSKYGVGTPLTFQQAQEFDTNFEAAASYTMDPATRKITAPAEDSVILYLNFLESMAVSIVDKDIDEAMVRKALKNNFVFAVKRFWPILVDDLKVQAFGDRPGSTSYAELYRLACRWGLTRDEVDWFYRTDPQLTGPKTLRAPKAPTWEQDPTAPA